MSFGRTPNRFGFEELRPEGGRSVLVFCPRRGLPFPAPEIKDQGWEVALVTKLEPARSLMDRLGGGVGIICLSERDLAAIGEVETLLGYGSSRFRWVAVLERSLLKNPAVNALISQSCLDFHVIPVDRERLLYSLGHAWGMAVLGRNHEVFPHEMHMENNIVGRSPSMLETFQRIRKVSQSNAPVLIYGETGTGKELCALAIHARSARSNQPFIAVNCGALPDKLIQSELFGHEKGAFTGAHQRKIGRIEAAAGGALFLDEIGDLSLSLQVNLLRVLQERTYERVGGVDTLKADMRVIAATNVDIEKAVGEKLFREDLFYRLSVLRLTIPPLRERAGDVELLANHWFSVFAKEKNPQVRGFGGDAMDAMKQYNWPGNVRELINRVRCAMVMCEHQLIRPQDLGLNYEGTPMAIAQSLADARDDAERGAVIAAIEHSRHNLSEAARSLGVSRVTLYRLLEKHAIMHRSAQDRE